MITVLIIEDDLEIRKIYKRIFKDFFNISADTAGSGKKGLLLFTSASYSLVILDIHLPDANGLDLLEEIKKIDPSTKVVIITGDSPSKNKKIAIEKGADDFLCKPLKINEMIGVINKNIKDLI
ncbi:response regulator [Elusimicrobiota bacterium]